MGRNDPGRIFSTAPVEISQRMRAEIRPPNSCRTAFSQRPSTPSMSTTSGR